jgi:hypothetical protein
MAGRLLLFRHMSPEAIVECRACQDACLDAVTHALRQGGDYADEEVVGVLLDATDVCRTNVDFLRRGSPRRTRTSAVTAEICTRAAEACATFVDDLVMRRCADACRRCAAICRELADSQSPPAYRSASR